MGSAFMAASSSQVRTTHVPHKCHTSATQVPHTYHTRTTQVPHKYHTRTTQVLHTVILALQVVKGAQVISKQRQGPN